MRNKYLPVEGERCFCERELRDTKRYRAFLKVVLQYANRICMSYRGKYGAFLESEWSFLAGKRDVFHFTDADGNLTGFEDLCFMKDARLVFCSCTHEAFCYANQELYRLMPMPLPHNQ